MKPFACVVAAACCTLATLGVTAAAPGEGGGNTQGTGNPRFDSPGESSSTDLFSASASTGAVPGHPAYKQVQKAANALFTVSKLAAEGLLSNIFEQRPWVKVQQWNGLPEDAAQRAKFIKGIEDRMTKITGLSAASCLGNHDSSHYLETKLGTVEALVETLLRPGFNSVIEFTADDKDAFHPYTPREFHDWSVRVENVRVLFQSIEADFPPPPSAAALLSAVMQAASAISYDLANLHHLEGGQTEPRLLSAEVLVRLTTFKERLEANSSARQQKLVNTRKSLDFLRQLRQPLANHLSGLGQLFTHAALKRKFGIYRTYADVQASAGRRFRMREQPTAADASSHDSVRRQQLSHLRSGVVQIAEILGGTTPDMEQATELELSPKQISVFMKMLTIALNKVILNNLGPVYRLSQPFYAEVTDFLEPVFADKMSQVIRKLQEITNYFADDVFNTVEVRVVADAYIGALDELNRHLTAFASQCNGNPALARDAFMATMSDGSPRFEEYVELAENNDVDKHPIWIVETEEE